MTLFKNVECLQEYKVREQRNVNLDMGNRAHAPILVKKKQQVEFSVQTKKAQGDLICSVLCTSERRRESKQLEKILLFSNVSGGVPSKGH